MIWVQHGDIGIIVSQAIAIFDYITETFKFVQVLAYKKTKFFY
jgi:hypothetical protein